MNNVLVEYLIKLLFDFSGAGLSVNKGFKYSVVYMAQLFFIKYGYQQITNTKCVFMDFKRKASTM